MDKKEGMRLEEVYRELVGPDWAVAVGGMWAISIPLLSSVKRQELSKCVFALCVSVGLCMLESCE